ncbi:MAG: hypothetical protein JST91_13025 [Actinobacteria bacterium]|nr:hypothetical protein [Actinomycetota bacterium]
MPATSAITRIRHPVCALPGCRNDVPRWGDACESCRDVCGEYLVWVERETSATPEEVAEQLAARDRGTAHAYATQAAVEIAATTADPTAYDQAVQWIAQRRLEHHDTRLPAPAAALVDAAEVRKANQLCWLCEERHTCTREPHGWECDHCRTIT